MRAVFGVLGPVSAWDETGEPIALKGPRHRAVLARLIVARRRVVPVGHLVDDLWEEPPAGAVSAVRTFVAALRRALEPERPPRAPARLLVTEGPGYALRAEPDAVDAWRFERAVTAATTLPPADALVRLDEALGWWRGPGYADFAEAPWARAERARLAELRLHAVERRAGARLALGLAAEAVPDLDAHVTEHPWREDAWRLLALALYRTGRQGDALAVLRRARALLVEQLGVDPGPGLRQLEADVLDQAAHLDVPHSDATPMNAAGLDASGPDAERPSGAAPAAEVRPAAGLDAPDPEAPDPDAPDPAGAAARVWARAAADYDRAVSAGARARLESTVGLLRSLALTGGEGLEAARAHRVAAVAAAEELGDPELTARVIGAYDVPAIWTRADDPEQAARIVAAAERTLAALPAPGHAAARARLLATIALETRGTRSPTDPPEAADLATLAATGSPVPAAPASRPPAPRATRAAREAEEIARSLDDPALLAFALGGRFMQCFERAGLAPDRDAIGAELVALSARHGLVTYEVLGHLVRVQARCALADFTTADRHAAAVDDLAERHELPLVGVFTQWYRALRLAATGQPTGPDAEAAYRAAAARLDGAGMPGLERGLLPLALLCLRLTREDQGAEEAPGAAPPPADPAAGQGADRSVDRDTDWGPYAPWVRPLLLLAGGRRAEAATALRAAPPPPHDLLYEAMWCLVGRAAIGVGDRAVMRLARTRLLPAAGELAGAGSGLLTLGPVARHLAALDAALAEPTNS
ncbi:BTAD domain-containing putative transcriptional regulator [Streptomyces sp. 71268]|uniref:BTAD domain-containing putative transcriptional regulator n=1 Tax=Streptomyces sp. 71268 TaxID=3002640 RepID=UPI0023F9E508|nr:BTAD domain-containing putative transcriptional regulator [Streptomyces sp. 71268]WEV29760.1 BTAD domain-containing putative transcriptional regulator [Streptomyces sp. 71268]